MSMKRVVTVVSIAVLLAGAGGVIWRVQAASGDRPSDVPRGNFTISEARSFADFALYDAGASALGLPRVTVLRRDDGPTDYVSFIYGDCAATDGVGCAPPAEIQVWPACARNLSLYGRQDGPPAERATVRGAPALLLEGGRRLELQTGTSTVVVFARTRDDVFGLAALLRGVNVPVRAGDELPRAAAGAVAGRLECRR